MEIAIENCEWLEIWKEDNFEMVILVKFDIFVSPRYATLRLLLIYTLRLLLTSDRQSDLLIKVCEEILCHFQNALGPVFFNLFYFDTPMATTTLIKFGLKTTFEILINVL